MSTSTLPFTFEEITEQPTQLDARAWHGSFNGRESTLQQLSPYVGKMKSGMARVLINLYSKPGDTVLDPFSGSGVVPFEAAILSRFALANDLSPYAFTLTRGKLEAPASEHDAIKHAKFMLDAIECKIDSIELSSIPQWIQDFYHPDTLKEIVAAFDVLKEQEDYFLISCLLGIMHHQRPGFLSYPASHLVPYLRKAKFPPSEFPAMYAYRDLRSRLLAKVKRAYRRPMLPHTWGKHHYKVMQANARNLPVSSESVDAIISSPPYFGALDYARDNRLRLWFLGCDDWKKLDTSLTASSKVYLSQMRECLREMARVLKQKGYCVLVLGDVERDGEMRRTAEILADLAIEVTNGQLSVVNIYDDYIPDERRSRRKTKTTKFERILVMCKSGG